MSLFRIGLVFVPCVLNAFALVAGGLEHRPIGTVGAMFGRWCRNGSPLKSEAQLFLDDDIRYCSDSLIRSDSIVIDLDGPPRHSRTYNCSTEGVCNRGVMLWLLGAYLNRDTSGANATLLLSRPKVSGVGKGRTPLIIPDLVVKEERGGVRLPAEVLRAVSDSPIKVCSIANDEPTTCTSYKPSSINATIPIGEGLYGIYGDAVSPRALLLVTSKADLVERWNQVPEPFRNDTAIDSVNERRRYLLDLVVGGTR